MKSLTLWINAKLEAICAFLAGTSVIAFDISTVLLKLILAFFLGAIGALGGHVAKILIAKFKRK